MFIEFSLIFPRHLEYFRGNTSPRLSSLRNTLHEQSGSRIPATPNARRGQIVSRWSVGSHRNGCRAQAACLSRAAHRLGQEHCLLYRKQDPAGRWLGPGLADQSAAGVNAKPNRGRAKHRLAASHDSQ